MKIGKLLLASTVVASLAAFELPASAATLCPTGSLISGTGACDFVITFNADGTITTTATSVSGGSSFGGEDALIGAINNSGSSISSFALTGGLNDIFGFDGDGIDTYTGLTPNMFDGGSLGGYGGPITYFTGINSNSTGGTVNFIGGLASGASTYFSLEDAIQASAPPVITAPPVTTPPVTTPPVTAVPEPASLALVGAGLVGLFAARRRRNTA